MLARRSSVRNCLAACAAATGMLVSACAAGGTRPAAATASPPAAAAPTAIPQSRDAASPQALEEARRVIEEGYALLERREHAAALAALQGLVDSPAFGLLDPVDRRNALGGAAQASRGLRDDPRRTYALAFRASVMPESTPFDWYTRFTSAWNLREFADCILSLTVYARRWPERLADVEEWAIFNVAGIAARQPDDTASFELLDALFQAGWAPATRDASELWRDLALLLLARGDVERAREVAVQVRGARALLSMRADRRFDAIVRFAPERFDVEAAHAAEVERLRMATRRSPPSLAAVVQLVAALSGGERHEEAIAVAREALRDLDSSSTPYADADENRAPLLVEEGLALLALGRWDEGVRHFEGARGASKGPGVTETLELAELYCVMGRPRDALATIARLADPDMSAFGRMTREFVRASAAAQLADAAGLERALAYLREHREDGIERLQSSLVDVGRVDEAAELLIARLEDSRHRNAALVYVQDYPNRPRTRRAAMRDARWKAILARADVNTAIVRVGRIERYAISP